MTLRADTLSCDSIRLAHWQGNSAYDYNRELQTPELDLIAWLKMQLSKLLSGIFGSRFAEEYTETILIIIFIVIVLLLVWFVYRKRPELFTRAGKKTVPYAIHDEDTIYGVDFDAEIAAALDRQDYREAIRLLYLQTLKSLSDDGVIDWQLYKTPTQYMYEVKPESRRDVFCKLTNGFLRVRYGNFEATEQLFAEMKTLQAEIEKGGEL